MGNYLKIFDVIISAKTDDYIIKRNLTSEFNEKFKDCIAVSTPLKNITPLFFTVV